jgi:hypothetical protein
MAQPKKPDPLAKVAQERHVNIFSTGGKNVVWPPYLLVKEGEVVVIRAINTPVTIHLPRPAVLKHSPGAGEEIIDTLTDVGLMIEIPEGKLVRFKARERKFDKKFTGWLKSKSRSREYPKRGIYAYSAFCKKQGDFAEGNSSPVMIFEPPDPPPSKRKPGEEPGPP